MARSAITANDKLDFVQAIIASDTFTKSDDKAIRILQQIIDDAKHKIATQTINEMDRNARKDGKFISNKSEAIKVARKFQVADQDTILAAMAREIGLDF
jgi:glutathionylspermidine synthase